VPANLVQYVLPLFGDQPIVDMGIKEA